MRRSSRGMRHPMNVETCGHAWLCLTSAVLFSVRKSQIHLSFTLSLAQRRNAAKGTLVQDISLVISCSSW